MSSSRKEILKKYFSSSIFTYEPNSSLIPSRIKVRLSQKSLLKTKDDLFNTEKNYLKKELSQREIKRQMNYNKIYGSDIFFRNKMVKIKKKESVKRLRYLNNFSDCFESMKNNEEFKRDIKDYTSKHRKEKREYNPDKYYLKEKASEIYFRQMYDSEGSCILPERPFSMGPENKKKYVYNKKHLINDIKILNDCGVDQKRKLVERKGLLTERKIYPKKNILTNHHEDKINERKKFLKYRKITPKLACKLNKRTNQISHIFNNNENNKYNIENNKTNVVIIKSKINRQNTNQQKTSYSKRELTNNDTILWGAVHSKWKKMKLNWTSPETEIMFGNTFTQEMKKNYGKKGPNAFQRMIYQYADNRNADTITGVQKEPINNIQKLPSAKNINGCGYVKIEKMLNNIRNLPPDKRIKIKNNATTAEINGEKDWNEKIKSLDKYYKNNYKILVNRKESLGKNWYDYTDYELTYPIKGQFEKFNETDIKKMFGKRGVHIYDIKKNVFDKGTFNSIKFKVRENKEDNNLNMKINEVKKDLEKNNYKVQIDKKDKKNNNKKMKNFVSNPGGKIGIMNENIRTENNDKNIYKIPLNKIRSIHSFSKEFKNVDYKYKQLKYNYYVNNFSKGF